MSQGAAAALLSQPRVRRLLAALDADGEETRIVGGAVRNAILGREVREIDFATTALPEETMGRARRAGLKAVPTGIEHGTVTIVVEGAPFEVTTLREDVETDGRHAVVRFGRDFDADARRRDFTINALSLAADGTIRDPVGGLADLAARRVRFIGDAGQRIREDYLRILRFFRFSAHYGEGPLDPAGLDAAVRERGGLALLSRERVGAELLKLLSARRVVEVVGILADCGFCALLIGAVGERGRLARAAARPGAPDPLLRLAAFAVLTAEDAERLRHGLRLSNAESERLATYAALVARLKSRDQELDEAEIRRLVFAGGVAPVADALAVIAGEPRPVVGKSAAAALDRLARGTDPLPAFPLAGADLTARGLAPGPALGRILKQARKRWLAAGCPPGLSSDELLADLLP
jgi:poly(A) polymerase